MIIIICGISILLSDFMNRIFWSHPKRKVVMYALYQLKVKLLL